MVRKINITPLPKKKLERINGGDVVDFVEKEGWVGFCIFVEFEDGRIIEKKTSVPLNSETELTPAYYFTVGIEVLASVLGAEYNFIHEKKDFTKSGNIHENYEN